MDKQFECGIGDVELAEKAPLSNATDISSSSDNCERNSSELDSAPSVGNTCINILIYPVAQWSSFYQKKRSIIFTIVYSLLLLAYAGYFVWALVYNSNGAIPLVALTSTVVVIVFFELCSLHFGKKLQSSLKAVGRKECRKKLSKAFVVVGILLAVGFMLWLLIDVIMRNPRQLFSLFGFFVILLMCIWGSKFPQKINWRPVIWGIALQFILGVIVLRTEVGYQVIKFIGDEIATFMNYSEKGAAFVFGEDFKMHLFAFKVLPMIIFFSTFTNMMFYLGLMQWFIGKLSFFTQITLGTSAIESTVAAANIFVGMTEAPLVVRPYLSDLTKAEIHSVLTAGLGSIAFSVFGVFVNGFKISGVHLLTACVMSAPAGLVVSRMLYPEKEKSKFTNPDSLRLTSGTARNIVEAAAVGASTSISLVANIAANLIAFLGLLGFVNSSLKWFGSFVGIPQLTFELSCDVDITADARCGIPSQLFWMYRNNQPASKTTLRLAKRIFVSYVFMPVAFLLGADWEDCFVVGKLFGMKTFLNEFVAYEDMKPYIENRLNGTFAKYDMDGNIRFMSERSEVIAIHALCGFCNISSLGIIIGGLSVLMPSRKSDIVELAVRSLIGGMLTCCMTASIAGFLFMPEDVTVAIDATTIATLVDTT